MKKIINYRYFIANLAIALIPIAALLSPAIRGYINDYYSVSAIYNTIIIALYIAGSVCALSSSWAAAKNESIIKHRNADKESSLLLNMNKVLFSKDRTEIDVELLNELADGVVKTRAQRMSFISSCSNIATLIGLLGTFAGLSLTIGSIGNLLDGSTSAGGSSTDTLAMIVNMVSSLTEPLKGMNTAFVSSIYGVICAILLMMQGVFVRDSFSKVLNGLTKIRLNNTSKYQGKVRSVRFESQDVAEIKNLFINFIEEYKDNEISQKEYAASNDILLKEGNKLLGSMLQSNNENLVQLSSNINLNNQAMLDNTNKIYQVLALTQQKNDEFRSRKMTKMDKIESDLNSGIQLLSDKDNEIIAQSKNIDAEMASYKDSFIPLLGKITSMYQSLSKSNASNKGVENDK
ncbi:TPA: MotA/TolQ/ExbB proton channel family protein [Yersinia enterocolitica]|nr:MotA/TolQ/ExbB proton channel family protein [Yersinia enterocolitica]